MIQNEIYVDNNEKKSWFINGLYLIGVLVVSLLLYNFLKVLLHENAVYFRGWIDKLYFFGGCSFIFLLIIEINYFLYKIMKKSSFQKVLSIISTVASIIITPILLFMVIFIYAFTATSEHSVYEHGQNLIVKVEGYGMHHTQVTYYEPINFLIMRKSNVESEIYDGAYDRYDRLK